ncbi:MAG TPA: NAD-dependent epimerase/dehydratase family protein [Stellaceae bacterium]|nr:NAD-dependent epimerase/dehydratase family protein [Stellaceae bacterium]
MARYLVTGGCGFIGSHLADALLAEGHDVRILDNLSTGHRENAPEASELMIGDVADRVAVRQAMEDMDGVFHLAAIASIERSIDDWVGTHISNLTGCITVFDAARRARASGPIPVVYASSAAIYGLNEDVPLAETARAVPMTAYGADKLGCELHAHIATSLYGVPTTGLRFFNVYGPRQNPDSPYSGVISIFCDRLVAGNPITIHGDGEQVRDFIHVTDVVRFLTQAMAVPAEGEVFNVCTGDGTSIVNLARTIGELCDTTPDLIFRAPRPGDVRLSVGDSQCAFKRFGVRAEMPLKDGLMITLAALRQRQSIQLRYA